MVGTPAYGVQRPPPQEFARAPTMPPPGRLSPRPMNRVHHETARVQFRPQRQWGGVFTVLLLLLAAAGVGVHLWVIPLDVLIAWGQPTGLDGVPLATTAPTTVTVWRDRGEHTIEATLAGYQLARETIRYDKAASLSYVVRLLRDPNAAPQAAPGTAAPATGPAPPGNQK